MAKSDKVIWKTVLSAVDEQCIRLPEGAMVLTAQVQRGDICLWFLCNPDRQSIPRRIFIVGTGNLMPYDVPARYIGTVQLEAGALVFHVFEEV